WMRLINGGPVKQLTTGMDGEIYGISLTGDRVMRMKRGRWETVSHIPPLNNVKKIAVHNYYYLLAIKKDNSIYEYRNRKWNKLDGSAVDITYDKRKSIHYIVENSRRIFKWDATTRKWKVLAGTRNDFAVVAAHDGQIWGTTVEHEIYEYTNRENTAFNPRPPLDFTNYAGTYRVTVTRILGLNWPGHAFNGRIAVYMTAKGGTPSGSVSQNIRPLNRRSNVILEEYSRSLTRRPISPEDPQNFIYISSSGPEEPFSNSPYEYAYTLYDMTGLREFKLEGQNANANAELSFQFQLKTPSSNSGKEEEVILKVREIKFNEEYFFVGDESWNTGICFKIEKQ
ncbi:MAG: tectonin domain-containing protein, partial [Bacteroidota bacterium]